MQTGSYGRVEARSGCCFDAAEIANSEGVPIRQALRNHKQINVRVGPWNTSANRTVDRDRNEIFAIVAPAGHCQLGQQLVVRRVHARL